MTLPVGPTDRQLAAELAAAEQATRGLREQLERASRAIIALYLLYSGGMGKPIPPEYRRVFADRAAAIIAAVVVEIQDDLWDIVMQALAAGRDEAMAYIADQAATAVQDQLAAQPARLRDWITQVVSAVQARAQAALASAQSLPHIGGPPEGQKDVMKIVAAAHQAVNQADRDARWAANAAYNQGVREAADLAGQDLMWIAERDACLHCLALSGEISRTGRPFNSDRTFYIGPDGHYKPLAVYPPGPLWGPPRHPNCRCFLRPVPELADYPVMSWETGPTTPAQALQREARRSVLKGMSGSDSRPARLRAVSALLAVGAGLPKSVVAKARAAVRAGEFK